MYYKFVFGMIQNYAKDIHLFEVLIRFKLFYKLITRRKTIEFSRCFVQKH